MSQFGVTEEKKGENFQSGVTVENEIISRYDMIEEKKMRKLLILVMQQL